MSTGTLSERADAVRRFNRFYTRQIGVLQESLLRSGLSLTEVRILYELAHHAPLSPSDLCRELGLDAGYVSRVTARFERQGYLRKERSAEDARVVVLTLTALGQSVFAPLEETSRQEMIDLLAALPDMAQVKLLAAMGQIESVLGDRSPSYLLRDPRPGDMGLVVSRQAALYAREFGWNAEYEALVSEIVAKYLRELDPARERCWIAEKDGDMVGSVFVVRQDDTTAKLRLLYVDATARGMGIGARLVEECIAFATSAGYTRMTLWTNSVLADARRLYERAGFQLVQEAPHHSFGHDLLGQVWERAL